MQRVYKDLISHYKTEVWLNNFFLYGTGYSKPINLRKYLDQGYDYPSVTVANTVPVYRKINQRETDVLLTILYQQYKTLTMPDDKKIHTSVSILTGDSINVGNQFKSDYFSDLGRVYVSPDHKYAGRVNRDYADKENVIIYNIWYHVYVVGFIR